MFHYSDPVASSTSCIFLILIIIMLMLIFALVPEPNRAVLKQNLYLKQTMSKVKVTFSLMLYEFITKKFMALFYFA